MCSNQKANASGKEKPILLWVRDYFLYTFGVLSVISRRFHRIPSFWLKCVNNVIVAAASDCSLAPADMSHKKVHSAYKVPSFTAMIS